MTAKCGRSQYGKMFGSGRTLTLTTPQEIVIHQLLYGGDEMAFAVGSSLRNAVRMDKFSSSEVGKLRVSPITRGDPRTADQGACFSLPTRFLKQPNQCWYH